MIAGRALGEIIEVVDNPWIRFCIIHHRGRTIRMVQQMEFALCKITPPVIGGPLPEHGTFTTGPKTSNDLVFRIVVDRIRIFVQIKSGKATKPALHPLVIWFTKSLVN